MEKEKAKEEVIFKMLRHAPTLNLDKCSYFISTQMITFADGNSTEHLVIKKQPVNEDGSPKGSFKSMFIPIEDAVGVLEFASEFVQKKIKEVKDKDK